MVARRPLGPLLRGQTWHAEQQKQMGAVRVSHHPHGLGRAASPLAAAPPFPSDAEN